MLQSLFALTEQATLTLVVARGAVEGTLALTVLPKPTTAAPQVAGKPVAAFERPLQFVGTPDDIEAAFAEQMQTYTEAYQGLSSTVTDACASIAASQKEAKDAATASAKAAKSGKTGVKPQPSTPVASAKPAPVPASAPAGQAGLFDGAPASTAPADAPTNAAADDEPEVLVGVGGGADDDGADDDSVEG